MLMITSQKVMGSKEQFYKQPQFFECRLGAGKLVSLVLKSQALGFFVFAALTHGAGRFVCVRPGADVLLYGPTIHANAAIIVAFAALSFSVPAHDALVLREINCPA
jgi:hypothetical protein